MKQSHKLTEKVVKYVNHKNWWHVPPADPSACIKRGKFFASSFAEAEFWGRPLDQPQRVFIAKPLIGDESTVSKELGIPPQREGMTLKQIAAHDALWRNAALKKGYDAILLMSPISLAKLKATKRLPSRLELNIL